MNDAFLHHICISEIVSAIEFGYKTIERRCTKRTSSEVNAVAKLKCLTILHKLNLHKLNLHKLK